MAWFDGSEWLSIIFEYLIKSTLALTLALILVLLFRGRPASLRHFILSLSLAGLLLLPVIPYLGGGWETSLLPARSRPAWASPSVSKGEGPGEIAVGGSNYESALLLLPGSPDPVLTNAQNTVPGSQFERSMKTVVPLAWAAGLAFLMLRLAAGIFGAFRLTREGKPIRDPRWRVIMERLPAVLGLQREVRLRSHRDIRIPLTCGFIRPVVLIPDGHESWTEDQRSSTLIHELAHIKRADFLVMVLVRLSLAFFWFNPLSWVVFRRLKKEQEEACDELALRTGIKPSAYAANLLFFKSAAGARLGHFAALLGLIGLGRSSFNERLASILKQKWTFQEVKMRTKLMLFCAVMLAVALIGLARPSAPDPAAERPAEAIMAAAGGSVTTETAPPVRPDIPAVGESQEKGQVDEKKAQEKNPQEAQAQEKPAQVDQEQKEGKKKPVVVTIKEGEKRKHKIIHGEGDKVKTIVVDKPVVIKDGKEGKIFIITPEGREIEVADGAPVHLEVIGDHLETLEAGKVIKVGKDDGIVYVVVDPAVQIRDAVKIALRQIPVALKAAELAAARGEAGSAEVDEALKAAEPALDVAKAVEAALEEVPVVVKVGEHGSPHMIWVAKDQEKEIQEKLREIREKLKAVEDKKLELREVDEALADLEKEIEKMSREPSWVALEHMEKPETFTVIKKKGGQETVVEVKPDIGVDISETSPQHPVKVVVKEKGSFTLFGTLGAGGKGREAYDRVVARVMKELPEGYALEPSFEEQSGLITLKVRGPFEKGAPHDLVQKLAGAIRDELKENKD